MGYCTLCILYERRNVTALRTSRTSLSLRVFVFASELPLDGELFDASSNNTRMFREIALFLLPGG